MQRVYALDSVYDEFRELLAAETRALNERKGDPWDRNTFMSPMIAPDETKRVASWVEDAQSKGANVVAGGGIDGFIHRATPVSDLVSSHSHLPILRPSIYHPLLRSLTTRRQTPHWWKM